MKNAATLGSALVLMIATPVAAAPVPVPDQVAIRAFLTKLYGTYRNDDPSRGWSFSIGEKSVFTPSTNALQSENSRLLHGEVGAIEADVFCGCQDYDKMFRLLSIAFRSLPAGRVNATALIDNHGRKSINIQLEKTPEGWRVYDVEVWKGGMLRKVLADENASLKHGG